MLSAIKSYLESNGYSNIYTDFMPDVQDMPSAINLTKWDHTIGDINDGSGTHYVQVQVRRDNYSTADEDCKSIFNLLDSGSDETVIQLTADVFCICRPRRGPLILDRGAGYTTFYCEIAVWGEN